MIKIDPYVKISFKGKDYKTKVSKNGGKEHVWNKYLIAKINDIKESVFFTVMDSNMFRDEIIGIYCMKIDKKSISKEFKDLTLSH